MKDRMYAGPVFFFIPDRRTICVLGFDVPPTYDRYDELLEKLKPTGTKVEVGSPVCIKFVPKPE